MTFAWLRGNEMTLVEFLCERCEVEPVGRRCDAVLAAAALRQTDGSVFILVERTYREGVCVIENASAGELNTLEEGNLWDLWNSERAVSLRGVI